LLSSAPTMCCLPQAFANEMRHAELVRIANSWRRPTFVLHQARFLERSPARPDPGCCRSPIGDAAFHKASAAKLMMRLLNPPLTADDRAIPVIRLPKFLGATFLLSCTKSSGHACLVKYLIPGLQNTRLDALMYNISSSGHHRKQLAA
jgi:hypothetical protein